MASYFISDLHLSDHEPHLYHLFEKFINTILKPHDELYILGDLFAFWIGDDQDSLIIREVKQLLCILAKRHIRWYFLAGNRDFLLGEKFLTETQGILLPEKYVMELGAHKTLLLHGDTLCTLDVQYQAYRQKIQRRWFQKLFLWMPLKWRLQVAEKMRQKSMVDVSKLTDAMMDVTPEAVQHDFEQFGVDVMIHGHVHRPAIHAYYQAHESKWCWRYVLADWNTKGNYLKFENDEFELRYFD